MTISYKYKFSLFSLFVGLSLAYSIYWKNRIDRFETEKYDNILQLIPKVTVKDFVTGNDLSLPIITSKSTKGLFIHFWGTWCAPCELELPAFLAFAKRYSDSGVKFILLAVNDKREDIEKFMKRFSDLPANVVVAIDENGSSMQEFGTVKVPETYVFNVHGRNLAKFIGPQDWARTTYMERIDLLLDLHIDKK